MDRGSAKLEELISRIRFSQYNPDVNLDEAMCGAMPVKPDRVSVPDLAGILDPRMHLSPERAKEFETMPDSIPIHGTPPGDCRACHKVDPKDWPGLLRKLHKAGMISFVPEHEALHENGRVIKGGLFCVPHKAESDRLINDRRPLNMREQRLGWCELPSGVMLCQIILEDSQSIRASGDDLSNYFYLIKHLDEWLPRNCFGHAIRGSKLGDLVSIRRPLTTLPFEWFAWGIQMGLILPRPPMRVFCRPRVVSRKKKPWSMAICFRLQIPYKDCILMITWFSKL